MKFGPREYSEGNNKFKIVATLKFDDECRNGHSKFSITGSINAFERGVWRDWCCGCIHDEIAEHFPKLAHLIKWRMTSTDGPMHYIANTCYLAGNRGCNGLLAGEVRQLKNGRSGVPAWSLMAVTEAGDAVELHTLPKNIDAATQPECQYKLEYRPWCRVGEGKERQLDAARAAAVWPDATDEELCMPKEELEKALLARLPALMVEFKAAMIGIGFDWPEGTK